MSATEKIPLVVSMGYGFEHEAFVRAKNIWSAYRNYFPDVDLIFMRSSHDVGSNEYTFANGEYVFGMPKDLPGMPLEGMAPHDAKGFVVDRQLKLYQRLLDTYQQPFWLYATTVTSAIDFRALRAIVDTLNCKETYAGSMLLARIPEGMGPELPADRILRIVSGAGTLLSSDLMELALIRSGLVTHHMLNDVWLSLILRDIPRIPLPRYDLADVTEFTPDARSLLHARIQQARSEGHFHFRVKSGRWEDKGFFSHKSEDIDPVVVNSVLLDIIASAIHPDIILDAWRRLKQQACDLDGQAMRPVA